MLWFLYYKSLFFPSSTTNPCFAALPLTRSSFLPQLFHLLIWLYCSSLYVVEILSCPTFDNPVFFINQHCYPYLKNLKFVFEWLSAYPSPISHHVDSFKDGKLWYCPSDEVPVREQLSFPHQQTSVFHLCCSSSPLPYPEICSCPFCSFQTSPFPFAENVKLTCCCLERGVFCFYVHVPSSHTYILFWYGLLDRNHVIHFYSPPTRNPSSVALKHFRRWCGPGLGLS